VAANSIGSKTPRKPKKKKKIRGDNFFGDLSGLGGGSDSSGKFFLFFFFFFFSVIIIIGCWI
jgi:hypothetical protein